MIAKITENIEAILQENFETEDYEFVPTHNNKFLDNGNTGKSFSAAVLYIDMRGSTIILKKFNKQTVAKLHKAYFEAIIPIVMRMGGRIRSYNGDSLLAFFNGTPTHSISDAVKAAMQINYIFYDEIVGVNQKLKKYKEIDFGIGIDYGEILCTKIGSKKYEYSTDLIWVGHPVNKSVRLGDKARYPKSVYISKFAFDKLSHRVKYVPKRGFFGKYKEDLWSSGSFEYGGETEECYYSSYKYPFS
ncbi:MAG: adenylate/guanylate cyclase domain-containing protein [Saprospiraceae bacterium]|nr:adenylate/guanylate cyclase domain-containing protein [Saprospiraceae bacterium]MCF8248747.1 adenylate/guanylate cyclase domain-containing protein [Saprospiraceae bacterium]MCF8278763.1 adenylate/guanylate cyclase domain-containing protein [Bacteroidales bacterium]MCF8310563.1 adenylate/guanylate cyclase domain-containing protein [Saprospiraceae bacterium]MCF8439122.1 adenylate/guanylate cyclase domain-containing protein [Saprospiraceae bacterium]